MTINSVWILGGSVLALTLAYRLYGRFLSRTFGIDVSRKTPAHEKQDGVDFVPAKNWFVLFGHHFSSICGAGPIVGPALACAYWGWGPSVVWLIVGAIWMGAVSDFSSLFISVRSDGQSVSEIAKAEVSPRARLFFGIFIWISIILVIAVFAIFAAKTFIQEPDTTVPSVGLIPTAIFTGWLLYRRRMKTTTATIVGLSLLAVLLMTGTRVSIPMPGIGALTPERMWILLLLIYCFAASVLPVQFLLQPRDYLASYLLFVSIGIGVAGIFILHPPMPAEAFHAFLPGDWPAVGMLWPMLFVTIACGAISGFHSLISSGTTCKQLDSESHACRIGYGGMLIECLVGVLVVICVSAGMSRLKLGIVLRGAGPIAAYSEGYGALSKSILGSYGRPFAMLALNAFILTTLDSATRIARYLTTELFGIKNKYAATAIVVLLAAVLALTGQWNRLWPAFGAANQLIAALSLLVVSCWLLHRGRRFLYTFVPAIFMLITTVGALLYQLVLSLRSAHPDYFISAVALILIATAGIVFAEAMKEFFRLQPAGRA